MNRETESGYIPEETEDTKDEIIEKQEKRINTLETEVERLNSILLDLANADFDNGFEDFQRDLRTHMAR